MIPTLLQISEAAQHAPAIIREAGQVQTPTGVFALLTIAIMVGFGVLGLALYLGLRKGGEKAGEAAGSSAASKALGEIERFLDEALPDDPEERKKAVKGWATVPQKLDGLTKKVEEQGEAIPAAVAKELAEQVRIKWNGGEPRVEHTPARGLRAVGAEDEE